MLAGNKTKDSVATGDSSNCSLVFSLVNNEYVSFNVFKGHGLQPVSGTETNSSVPR